MDVQGGDTAPWVDVPTIGTGGFDAQIIGRCGRGDFCQETVGHQSAEVDEIISGVHAVFGPVKIDFIHEPAESGAG